jgi:hypothetical protein
MKWTKPINKPPPAEKPLACRNGCGKRFSYPGHLRNHEKTCVVGVAPGYGDATGIWSPPARKAEAAAATAMCATATKNMEEAAATAIWVAQREAAVAKRKAEEAAELRQRAKARAARLAEEAAKLRQRAEAAAVKKRCRMGCGGFFVYLAIHELECVAQWRRPAPKSPKAKDASLVPKTLSSPIANSSNRRLRLACRKGCGATYAYVKCLRQHEMNCLGIAGVERSKHTHSSETKNKNDAAKDSCRDEDKEEDVPETHEARAAANDAFTRAVFARLADAGGGEQARFKWLSPAGTLATGGEGSGAAEGPPASEEEKEARKDAEVDIMLRERFPCVEP